MSFAWAERSDAVAPGRPSLKVQLRRAERRQDAWSFSLVLPAVLFLALTFLAPIGYFLYYSIANPEIPGTLPRTVDALRQWDGDGLPAETAYRAVVEDLRTAERSDMAVLARRLNYHQTGFRSLILITTLKLPKEEVASYKQALIDINPKWGEPGIWTTLKQQSGAITPFYLLAAIDLKQAPNGSIVSTDENKAIYVGIFERTFWMSAFITVLCVVLGFPLAYLLASLPLRVSNWLLLLVLLPFWTSLLVRTLAWLIVLQKRGVANDVLLFLGLPGAPYQLLHTRLAVYLAMVHILLPFVVLPLYSVMKRIPPSHMKAAAGLGANPTFAFCTVYLPQTLPGIGAGALLVSILALGFYITPSLLGGPDDQMISFFIAFYTNQTVNWGMASALGVWLLLFAAVLFALLNRFVGIDRMRFG